MTAPADDADPQADAELEREAQQEAIRLCAQGVVCLHTRHADLRDALVAFAKRQRQAVERTASPTEDLAAYLEDGALAEIAEVLRSIAKRVRGRAASGGQEDKPPCECGFAAGLSGRCICDDPPPTPQEQAEPTVSWRVRDNLFIHGTREAIGALMDIAERDRAALEEKERELSAEFQARNESDARWQREREARQKAEAELTEARLIAASLPPLSAEEQASKLLGHGWCDGNPCKDCRAVGAALEEKERDRETWELVAKNWEKLRDDVVADLQREREARQKAEAELTEAANGALVHKAVVAEREAHEQTRRLREEERRQRDELFSKLEAADSAREAAERDHHKNWPDCPRCVQAANEDFDAQRREAELSAALSAAEERVKAMEADAARRREP